MLTNEQILIGCVLKDPSKMRELSSELGPSDFLEEPTRRLYELILRRYRNGMLPDTVELPLAVQARHDSAHFPSIHDFVAWPDQLGGSVEALPAWIKQQKARGLRFKLNQVSLKLGQADSETDLDELLKLAEKLSADLRAVAFSETSKSDPFRGQWMTVAERMGDDDWLASDPPNREWLLVTPEVDGNGRNVGFLPRGKVGLLAAGGGAGKTMALLQLALAVALPERAHRSDLRFGTGRKQENRSRNRFGWFARHDKKDDSYKAPYWVEKGGRVLCILGEEDEEEIRRRLHKVAKSYGLTGREQDFTGGSKGDVIQWRREALNRLVMVPGAGNPEMALTTKTADAGPSEIARAARVMVDRLNDSNDDGWALIILDPLSRFAGGDSETDNREATLLVQAAEELCKVRGNPTVLLAHHTSQSARQTASLDAWAARGVTAITDGIRWQSNMAPRAYLKNAPGIVDFRMSKTNYTKQAGQIALRWADDGGALVLASAEDIEDYAKASENAEDKKKKKDSPESGEDALEEELDDDL